MSMVSVLTDFIWLVIATLREFKYLGGSSADRRQMGSGWAVPELTTKFIYWPQYHITMVNFNIQNRLSNHGGD